MDELYGRGHQFQTFKDLLQGPHSKLWAIRGPGGIGKTALLDHLRNPERALLQALKSDQASDQPGRPLVLLIDNHDLAFHRRLQSRLRWEHGPDWLNSARELGFPDWLENLLRLLSAEQRRWLCVVSGRAPLPPLHAELLREPQTILSAPSLGSYRAWACCCATRTHRTTCNCTSRTARSWRAPARDALHRRLAEWFQALADYHADYPERAARYQEAAAYHRLCGEDRYALLAAGPAGAVVVAGPGGCRDGDSG